MSMSSGTYFTLHDTTLTLLQPYLPIAVSVNEAIFMSMCFFVFLCAVFETAVGPLKGAPFPKPSSAPNNVYIFIGMCLAIALLLCHASAESNFEVGYKMDVFDCHNIVRNLGVYIQFVRVAHPCHRIYSYIDSQCSSVVVSTSKSAALSSHQCSDIKNLAFSLFIETFSCFLVLPPNLNGSYGNLTFSQNATSGQLSETEYSQIHDQGSCFVLQLIVTIVVIFFLVLKRSVIFLLLSNIQICNNTTQRESFDYSGGIANGPLVLISLSHLQSQSERTWYATHTIKARPASRSPPSVRGRGRAAAMMFVCCLQLLVFVTKSAASCDSSCKVFVENQPLDTELFGGTSNMTVKQFFPNGCILCGRKQVLVEIILPFPFRWFDQIYNGSIFLDQRFGINFGGSAVDPFHTCDSEVGFRNTSIRSNKMRANLCPLNPPSPSVMIGTKQHFLYRIEQGPSFNPAGWLVRLFGPDVKFKQIDLYMELIFLKHGGLLMHTAQSEFVAVSDGLSSSFAKTFVSKPNISHLVSTSCEVFGFIDCSVLPIESEPLMTSKRPCVSCLKGFTPDMTTIYDKSMKQRYHLNYNIKLPFPFRWFDRVFNGDVFVNSGRIIFGDDASLHILRFPYSSLWIGTKNLMIVRLAVGPDPLGWRIRYEGLSDEFYSGDSPQQPLSNVVWEAVFRREGGLHLCTGWCKNVDIPEACMSEVLATNDVTGAITISTSTRLRRQRLVQKLELHPNSLYTFAVSCAQTMKVSLSVPIASLTGSNLSVTFYPGLVFSSADENAYVMISLIGAGFSCPANISISLEASLTSALVSGTATIVTSIGSDPVLRVQLSGVANRTVSSFTIPTITTPHKPQSAASNLSFVIIGSNGATIMSGRKGKMDAVLMHETRVPGKDENYYSQFAPEVPNFAPESAIPIEVTLSNPVARSISALTIAFGIPLHAVPSSYQPSAVVITLMGAGWSLVEGSSITLYNFEVSRFDNPFDPDLVTPQQSSMVQEGDSASVLTVSFSNADRDKLIYPSNLRDIPEWIPVRIIITVSSVFTPIAAQSSMHSIGAAVVNPFGSVLAAGNEGTLVAIEAKSAMGSDLPRVTMDPPLASFDAAMFSVLLVPSFAQQWFIDQTNLPARIVITLAGAGISCAADTPVMFIVPFDGAAATANVEASTSMPVLTVTLASGKFWTDHPISFQFGPCSTPSRTQAEVNNITAVMLDSKGVAVASSGFGTQGRIVGDLGTDQPKLVLVDAVLTMTITPSVLLPSACSLYITLNGMIFGTAAQLSVVSEASNVVGTASIENNALNSLLIVTFSTNIAARSAQTFTVSPVNGGTCSEHASSANIAAAAFHMGGGLLAASASGSFHSSSSNPTVSEIIASSRNGLVILPGVLFAGSCNCNNTIDQYVPPRSSGAIVELRGSVGATTIDCSGTRMRCLIVKDTSVSIVGIVFKGGSSPQFVSASVLQAIKLVQDSVAAQLAQVYASGAGYQSTSKYHHFVQEPSFMPRTNANPTRKKPLPKHAKSQRSTSAHPKQTRTTPNPRPEQFSHKTHKMFQNRQNLSSQAIQTQFHRARLPRHITVLRSQTPANVFKQRVKRRIKMVLGHQAPRAPRRRLLDESDPYVPDPYSIDIFVLDESQCGGCVAVLAPASSASLSGVVMTGCSAVYGGGGFFNVSAFTAVHGSAIGNVARQGGGIFVAAAARTDFISFSFSGNTVATTAGGEYLRYPSYNTGDSHYHKMLEADPAAAAGGGLWVQALSSVLHCVFFDNMALAAGIDSAALGSSMFVLSTQRDSVLSNLSFHRSALKCVDRGCISAGTLFIGPTGQGTVVSNLTFHVCTISAIKVSKPYSDPEYWYLTQNDEFYTGGTQAMGVCALFAGYQSKNVSITLRNVRSTQCSIQADIITGGCLYFDQLYNSTLKNTSAVDLVLIFSESTVGGFLTAFDVSNSSIVSTSVINLSSLRLQQSYFIRLPVFNAKGVGGLYFYAVINSEIAETSARNVTVILGFQDTEGVLIHINAYIINSSMVGTVFQNVRIFEGYYRTAEQPYKYEAYYNPRISGMIFISYFLNLSIAGTSLHGLQMFCPHFDLIGGLLYMELPGRGLSEDMDMDTTSISETSICDMNVSALSILGGAMRITDIDSQSGNSYRNRMMGISAQNISLKCLFAGCQVGGGVAVFGNGNLDSTLLFKSLWTVSNISVKNLLLECEGQDCVVSGALFIGDDFLNSSVSMVTASDIAMRCVGKSCNAAGGIFYGLSNLSKFSHFNIQNATLSCSGENCIASGAGLFFSRAVRSVVYNASFHAIHVMSFGNASTAVGSVINVLASNQLEIKQLQTQNTRLSSSGSSSLAVGGTVAVSAGSLILSNCDFRRSNMSCFGDECQSLGGFLASISVLPPPNTSTVFFTYLGSSYTLFTTTGWAANNITLAGASLKNAALSCSGSNCVASGGAVFAGVAYRGIKGWSFSEFSFTYGIKRPNYVPDENETVTITAPPGLAVMMRLIIDASSFVDNIVTSSSPGAVLAGAGLSFFPCIANISNSSITRNYIFGFEGVAFVGGAGIYVAAPKCLVVASATELTWNSVGRGGSGGGVFVGTEATFIAFRSNVQFNSAGKGGGMHVDGAHASISSSSIFSNVAAVQGGGLFCVNKRDDSIASGATAIKGNSTVIFKDVEFFNNTLSDPLLTVGASLYVFGAVRVEFDEHSRVYMSADRLRTVLETVLSVNEDNCIIPSMATTVCLRGTKLSIARTDVENQRTVLGTPTDDYQKKTRCYPACLFTPKLSSYIAASGILASCVPCAAGTYSFSNSSNVSETISEFCKPCPFGANCSGGNLVQTLDAYWGWKVSDAELASEFLQVPDGYGCEGENCEAIDSCGNNHSNILCGGCVQNFSAAFFTTSCVSDDECASWKAGLLVCGAFVYCFIFSSFLRYEAEYKKAANPSVPSIKSDLAGEIEQRSSAFQVLMWYYQLTGLLLAMPNPLKFFDGNALLLNIIGLVFGSVPVSQAFEIPSIVFCVKAGSAPTDIILANMLFYLLWALVMATLTFERVWLLFFNFIHAFLNFAPAFWEQYESACEAFAVWGALGNFVAFFVALKWTLAGVTFASVAASVWGLLAAGFSRARCTLMRLLHVISFKKLGGASLVIVSQQAAPTSAAGVASPAETRGKAWLDFGVAAYSALLSLMVQCTTCVNIKGLEVEGNASPELRWFYDGRVACFSDLGERSGFWQIAAVIGVVLLALMPLMLAFYMRRTLAKSEALYNAFDISALPAYVEQFVPSHRHWFTVMFYQRIMLTFVIFYTIVLNAPFLRGIIAWLVCMAILALDFVYKPFANPDMQRLSSACCFLLVTMSSVLLRSQSLLSSARPINFDPSSPNQAADTLPFDVRLTIVVILACIITPFIILLKPHRILQVFVLLLKSCWSRLQKQTWNEKIARADGSANLMQLPDAAPLVTAGVARAGKSNLEMDLFSSAIRNVSAIQAVIESSADPRVDGVKPVDQGFSVSQRVTSSRSGLNPIVSSSLARATVTNSLSVRRQQAAELISHNSHDSDDASQAPFAVILFEDIPAAPRSRSKSRSLKQTPASILSTAVGVSSSTLPTLSSASSPVIVSAPLTCDAPAVSPPAPQLRSRLRSRDDSAHSSHASVISSAALIPASTAPSAPPFLPAPGVVSSATAANPSPYASPVLASQTQRDRARAHRQAVADALAGATRTSDAIARFGDC